MSSSDVLVTVVQTAEELQGAVQHSAKHIEIRQHIDLTGSEPLNEEQHIVKKILGWPGAGVESIRVRIPCAQYAVQQADRHIGSLVHNLPFKRFSSCVRRTQATCRGGALLWYWLRASRFATLLDPFVR